MGDTDAAGTGVFRRYTYRLYPTVKQETALNELLWYQSQVHNGALEHRRTAWTKQKVNVGYKDQCRELTELKAVSGPDEPVNKYGTTVTRGTLKRVDRAFAAFYRRVKAGQTPGYPRWKAARRYDSVEYPEVKGWKLHPHPKGGRDGRLYLQGVGHVKTRFHRYWKGEPVTITVTRRGRAWEVSVACRNVPVTIPDQPETVEVVGVDRGITVLAATSEGVLHENPRAVRQVAERKSKAAQVLSRKRRGSKRHAKARARLRALQVKEARVRKDTLHKLSRTLACPGTVLVFEDLKVTNMTRSGSGTVECPGVNVAQKTGLNKAILDAGWGVMVQLTSYKAEEAGGRVELVPAFYSSQTCSSCGHVHGEDRKGSRYHCCSCGFTAHADVNAARVLAQRYKKQVQEYA